MESQQEGGRRQVKERGLKRNQSCRHLHLGFPDSRTPRTYISVVQATQSVVFCSLSKPTQFPSHPHSLKQWKILIQLGLGRHESEFLKSTQPELLGLHLEKCSFQRELHMFCQRGLFPAEYLHLSSARDPSITAAALDGRDLGPKMSAPTGPQSSHRWSKAKEQEAYPVGPLSIRTGIP